MWNSMISHSPMLRTSVSCIRASACLYMLASNRLVTRNGLYRSTVVRWPIHRMYTFAHLAISLYIIFKHHLLVCVCVCVVTYIARCTPDETVTAFIPTYCVKSANAKIYLSRCKLHHLIYHHYRLTTKPFDGNASYVNCKICNSKLVQLNDGVLWCLFGRLIEFRNERACDGRTCAWVCVCSVQHTVHCSQLFTSCSHINWRNV